MISSHQGMHDCLIRQKAAIEEEYEAAMQGIEDQREHAENELSATIKNNQNRIDILNATISYRGL